MGVNVRLAGGPLAKRKKTGPRRLRGGMLGMKTMLKDQVLGRLAMLALTLLVTISLKMGGKRMRRVLLGMQKSANDSLSRM